MSEIFSWNETAPGYSAGDHGSPNILFLDEPLNELDKDGVADTRELLLQFKESGETMIVTSRNFVDIDALCDGVFEMNKGELSALR